MSEEEKKLLEDVSQTVKHIREVKEIIVAQNPDKKTVKGIKTPEGNNFTVSNENKETTTGVKETGKGFKITVRQKNVTTSLGRSKTARAAAEKYFEDLKKLRENPELTPEQISEIDQILVPLQASFDRVNRAKQRTEPQNENEEEQVTSEQEKADEYKMPEPSQGEDEQTTDKSEQSEENNKMEVLKEIVEMEKEYQALVGKTSQYNGKSKEEIPMDILLQAEKLNEKILTATEEAGLNIDDVIKAYDEEMARIEAEKQETEKKEPTIEEQLNYIQQQLAIEEENLIKADEFEAPGISDAIRLLEGYKRELEEKQKEEEAKRKDALIEKRKQLLANYNGRQKFLKPSNNVEEYLIGNFCYEKIFGIIKELDENFEALKGMGLKPDDINLIKPEEEKNESAFEEIKKESEERIKRLNQKLNEEKNSSYVMNSIEAAYTRLTTPRKARTNHKHFVGE